MGRDIFVDTSAFYSALDKNDTNHGKSISLWDMLNEKSLVTTELVLIETATLIRAKLGAYHSIKFIDEIEKERDIEIVKTERLYRFLQIFLICVICEICG